MNKFLATVDIGSLYQSPLGQSEGIGDLVSLILNGAFALAGVGILFLLIFAGFSIIVGAGKSDAETTAKGKKAVTSALIGALIVFFAYFIVRIIELIFGVAFVTAPKL
jgi:hypothetical protein